MLCLICSLFPKNIVRGQIALEETTLITTDVSIGRENTGLYNGTQYVEFFRMANDRHKFYATGAFAKGSIIYNGQFYGDVNLKYDLNADDVLLNIGYEWNYPVLKLFKNRISEFSLDGKTFINIGDKASQYTKGFHEVLWASDSLVLLKKNQKKKFRRMQQTVSYFEFEDDSSYYIRNKVEIYPLRNKRDLVGIFPLRKKEIQNLYNKNMFKANPDLGWVQLFRSLQNSSLNER